MRRSDKTFHNSLSLPFESKKSLPFSSHECLQPFLSRKVQYRVSSLPLYLGVFHATFFSSTFRSTRSTHHQSLFGCEQQFRILMIGSRVLNLLAAHTMKINVHLVRPRSVILLENINSYVQCVCVQGRVWTCICARCVSAAKELLYLSTWCSVQSYPEHGNGVRGRGIERETHGVYNDEKNIRRYYTVGECIYVSEWKAREELNRREETEGEKLPRATYTSLHSYMYVRVWMYIIIYTLPAGEYNQANGTAKWGCTERIRERGERSREKRLERGIKPWGRTSEGIEKRKDTNIWDVSRWNLIRLFFRIRSIFSMILVEIYCNF